MRLSIDKKPKDTKVVVAMSGGVDSSTIAAVLKDSGYDVIGITLKLYNSAPSQQKANGKSCCSGIDIYDAKSVAEKMGFPHYTLDYQEIFKKSVIDDFAENYENGYTPVPCVRCNQNVKFDHLLKLAKDLEADALVTGHYVRKIVKDGNTELHMAIDKTKDQSYFLFATTKEQLDYIHFPLGEISKDETRELARKFGLTIADKPESQDICFVANDKYSNILKKLYPEKALEKGNIISENGDILGQHDGIINYTIGQRKGLGISAKEPLYVIKIDKDKSEVVVGDRSKLARRSFMVNDINWLAEFRDGKKYSDIEVKVRSSQKLQPAEIEFLENGNIEISLFDNSTTAIAPGQACVIYSGERVLGGGWIMK